MKPHKHAEVIKAWADGAQIQVANAGKGDWVDAESPNWCGQFEFRIKPSAPLIESKLAPADFRALFNGRDDSIYEALRLLANHAIRRAIADGQVIPAPDDEPADTGTQCDDPAEVAYWNFDSRKKGLSEWKGQPQTERDAFKAEYRKAVDAQARETARKMLVRSAARDMAVAVAVRGAAYDAVMRCKDELEGKAVRELDLAAIIAKVQP